MKMRMVIIMVLVVVAASATGADGDGANADRLMPLSEFQSIGNDQRRAQALFQEIGRVIQHPRCVNCHPRTEHPLQGENGALY